MHMVHSKLCHYRIIYSPPKPQFLMGHRTGPESWCKEIPPRCWLSWCLHRAKQLSM